MHAGSGSGPGKRISLLRLALLMLVLIMLVFGIIGALVIFMPQTGGRNKPELNGKTPQVRQIDRQQLRRDTSGPGA